MTEINLEEWVSVEDDLPIENPGIPGLSLEVNTISVRGIQRPCYYKDNGDWLQARTMQPINDTILYWQSVKF